MSRREEDVVISTLRRASVSGSGIVRLRIRVVLGIQDHPV